MMRALRLFFTALGFFTRIPCLRWADHRPEALNQAAAYFPLVGILVGASAAAVYSLSLYFWSPNIAVLLSMIATIWLTGAFHEDGLADSMDGLGGGWQREQMLSIMSDSRLGTYGAVALLLALLLKYQCLTELPAHLLPAMLIAAHALSRWAAVLVIATQGYVKSTGKTKPVAEAIGLQGVLLATAFGWAPLLMLPWSYGWALLAVALVWLYFSFTLRRLLGGYTGDCLGAMQQLTELAFYLGLLACRSI